MLYLQAIWSKLLKFLQPCFSCYSLPEVPALCAVPSVSVDFPSDPSMIEELQDLIDQAGRVSRMGPVQITNIVEQPGALLVSWEEVSFPMYVFIHYIHKSSWSKDWALGLQIALLWGVVCTFIMNIMWVHVCIYAHHPHSLHLCLDFSTYLLLFCQRKIFLVPTLLWPRFLSFESGVVLDFNIIHEKGNYAVCNEFQVESNATTKKSFREYESEDTHEKETQSMDDEL